MSRRAIMYAIGGVAVAALAGAAWAQSGASNTQQTPVNFDYVIKDGKRVPKPNTRIVNADGSVVARAPAFVEQQLLLEAVVDGEVACIAPAALAASAGELAETGLAA